MNIFSVVIIGVIGMLLALTVKQREPGIAVLISLAVSVVILFSVLPNFAAVFEIIGKISDTVDIGIPFVEIVVKIMGIAYLCEFGSQICVDAGETSIAGKIELAGKIVIMGISAPVVVALIAQVVDLI